MSLSAALFLTGCGRRESSPRESGSNAPSPEVAANVAATTQGVAHYPLPPAPTVVVPRNVAGPAEFSRPIADAINWSFAYLEALYKVNADPRAATISSIVVRAAGPENLLSENTIFSYNPERDLIFAHEENLKLHARYPLSLLLKAAHETYHREHDRSFSSNIVNFSEIEMRAHASEVLVANYLSNIVQSASGAAPEPLREVWNADIHYGVAAGQSASLVHQLRRDLFVASQSAKDDYSRIRAEIERLKLQSAPPRNPGLGVRDPLGRAGTPGVPPVVPPTGVNSPRAGAYQPATAQGSLIEQKERVADSLAEVAMETLSLISSKELGSPEVYAQITSTYSTALSLGSSAATVGDISLIEMHNLMSTARELSRALQREEAALDQLQKAIVNFHSQR